METIQLTFGVELIRRNYLLLTKQISYHHAIKSCELNKKKILIMNKVMHRVFSQVLKDFRRFLSEPVLMAIVTFM